jgi:hypothetical protein
VGPASDSQLLRKSSSAWNQPRDLWICSQELRPLDHKDAHLRNVVLNKNRTTDISKNPAIVSTYHELLNLIVVLKGKPIANCEKTKRLLSTLVPGQYSAKIFANSESGRRVGRISRRDGIIHITTQVRYTNLLSRKLSVAGNCGTTILFLCCTLQLHENMFLKVATNASGYFYFMSLQFHAPDVVTATPVRLVTTLTGGHL